MLLRRTTMDENGVNWSTSIRAKR